VFIGSNLVYSLSILNQGPFAAPNVVLTNVLPPSVNLIAASLSQGTLATNGNTLVASLGSLAVSSSAQVNFTVRPQLAGSITNVASVSSGSQDPNLLNNTNAVVTTVLPLPLLSIRFLPPNLIRLAWPVELTNYVLQSQLLLGSTNQWSNVLTAPVILNGENTVTQTNSPASKFYRLRK